MFILVDMAYDLDHPDESHRRPRPRPRDGETQTPRPGKILWNAGHFSAQLDEQGAYALQTVLVNFLYEACFGEEALVRANEEERRRALEQQGGGGQAPAPSAPPTPADPQAPHHDL